VSLVARTPSDLERRMNGTIMRSMPLHLAVMKNQPAVVDDAARSRRQHGVLDEAGFSRRSIWPRSAAASTWRKCCSSAEPRCGCRPRLALVERPTSKDCCVRDPGTLKPGGRWGNLIVRASERAPGDVIETLIRNGASVNVRDNPKTSIDNDKRIHTPARRGVARERQRDSMCC
jgi:hypothetical protein